MNCRIGFSVPAALMWGTCGVSPEVQAADRESNVIHTMPDELGVIGK